MTARDDDFWKKVESGETKLRWNGHYKNPSVVGGKRGRPSVPLSERKIATSVYLHPKIIEAACKLADGNLSRGLTQAVRMVMTLRETNEAAIKAAAESRDQEAVRRSGEPLREPKSAFDD